MPEDWRGSEGVSAFAQATADKWENGRTGDGERRDGASGGRGEKSSYQQSAISKTGISNIWYLASGIRLYCYGLTADSK